MLRLAILAAAISCILGAAIPEGMMPQLNGRIVDGTPTSVRSFPWQISLQVAGHHHCGGSIYTNRIIVTAAHCLQHSNIHVLRVRAGSSLWVSGGVLVPVAAFKNHAEYNPYTMVNDVSVIRLNTSLEFTSTIRPISLASTSPMNEAHAVVSGWGTTESGSNTLPSQLKSVDMKIITRDMCASSAFGYGDNIKDSMICTHAIGKDSCQGDSGGPLVSEGVLVGIVSWGFGCAWSKFPGVYADVAALRPWIIYASNSI